MYNKVVCSEKKKNTFFETNGLEIYRLIVSLRGVKCIFNRFLKTVQATRFAIGIPKCPLKSQSAGFDGGGGDEGFQVLKFVLGLPLSPCSFFFFFGPWTQSMDKTTRKLIAMEMWTRRKLLEVSWTEMKGNVIRPS